MLDHYPFGMGDSSGLSDWQALLSGFGDPYLDLIICFFPEASLLFGSIKLSNGCSLFWRLVYPELNEAQKDYIVETIYHVFE